MNWEEFAAFQRAGKFLSDRDHQQTLEKKLDELKDQLMLSNMSPQERTEELDRRSKIKNEMYVEKRLKEAEDKYAKAKDLPVYCFVTATFFLVITFWSIIADTIPFVTILAAALVIVFGVLGFAELERGKNSQRAELAELARATALARRHEARSTHFEDVPYAHIRSFEGDHIREYKAACQKCQTHIAYPAEMEGKTIKCPNCRKKTKLIDATDILS